MRNKAEETHIHVHPGVSRYTRSKTTPYSPVASAPPPETTCAHDAGVRDLRAMGLPTGAGISDERHSE